MGLGYLVFTQLPVDQTIPNIQYPISATNETMTTRLPPPPPGTLRLIQGAPNPGSTDDAQLFLFEGNATVAPIRDVELADGVSLPPRRTCSNAKNARLIVLHINDLHGHICRLTPEGDIPILSKIVGRIQNLRQRYQNDPDTAILALSAGDDLIGFVFDELLGNEGDDFMHVGYHLYSAAGIDAVTFGNHDLDMGVPALARSIEQERTFSAVVCQSHRWPTA